MLTLERQQFEKWWETAMHNGYPPRFGWEHWRDGDGYRDDDGEFQGLWQAWQASRGFLANREAQPVMWVMSDDLTDEKIISTPAYPNRVEAEERTVGELTPLYTAPPAPAVPPEKKLPELMMASYHEAIGWNACRAAMLAAAPEGGNDHDTRR
ncbi:hypothetical protein ABTW52_04595 [Serratia sp. SM29]|uniref:hypothetical protein n=1 Tax=Serratia TaxID=613 RepID=UPI003314D4ED